MRETIECASYQVTDPYFGELYVDADEWREQPHPHRYVHGGFAGCDTRFTFYLPPAGEWRGRLIQPLEGAHAGREDFFGGGLGDAMGGVGLTARLGGNMVESNMRHIGDDIDPKGGDDPALYGWRAGPRARGSPSTSPPRCTGPHHTTPMCGAVPAADGVRRCCWRTRRTCSAARCRSRAAVT